MKCRPLQLWLSMAMLVLAACSTAPEPTVTPRATATAAPPTAASVLPTHLPFPTATLQAPMETPLPASATVCAEGCDFRTIQAAIDGASDGAVIEVQDAMHSEAGIVVAKNVTIRGLGTAQTVVQAVDGADAAPDRVFRIAEGAIVILRGLTIRHGNPSVREELGGGILNEGTLIVQGCIVTQNLAGGGGGIANNGALTVIDSSIHHNTAQDVGAPGLKCGSGGGILSRVGTLTVINSTIHSNHAGLRSKGTGGGVRVGCRCSAVFANSTISGNESVNYGAGIAFIGPVRLIHCTIYGNYTKSEAAGLYVRGVLEMENTLIAGNQGPGAECAVIPADAASPNRGIVVTNHNNWVEDGSCEADFSGDPLLGPLSDNGGPTWTHALLPGSLAIDAVAADGCALPTDQRGEPRPAASSGADARCDVGAFEAQR
jgi:hypothetical protein